MTPRLVGRTAASRATVVLVLAAGACGPRNSNPESMRGERSAHLLADGSGGVNQKRYDDAPYVVLISIDGFRHDYLDLFDVPNLRRIVDGGVRAEAMIPVFPLKTFPNHYSIATGMYPARHGLINNRFYDPERDESYFFLDRDKVADGTWYGGEPLWVLAEQRGMVSAAFFWVGTEADVRGVRPTHWRDFDGSVPNSDRVDQVLAWLTEPVRVRPHMLTLYFEDVDQVGHRSAPESPEMTEAVRSIDSAIGRLLDGIATLPYGDQVYVVVVSDHGMAAFGPDRVYYLEDFMDLETVRLTDAGAVAFMYLDGSARERTDLRDRLAEAMPRAAVYTLDEVPERLHYAGGRRLGDVIIVPELGWMVADRRSRNIQPGWTHGWDPAEKAMHSVFLAMGPGIEPGKTIPPFENIHIYPWIAGLLGLEPSEPIDGDPAVLGGLVRFP
ncbi:MAG: ectonucleotide pyrophosphatase/phosphodiesterase [Gemmatimonadota bacterium]|nr:MAG: ectonucleotide pyrophosphatase/phosphodiesterase [Gemmatimonadota bacterium]